MSNRLFFFYSSIEKEQIKYEKDKEKIKKEEKREEAYNAVIEIKKKARRI